MDFKIKARLFQTHIQASSIHLGKSLQSYLESPISLCVFTGLGIAGCGYLINTERKTQAIWHEIFEKSKDLKNFQDKDCVLYFEAHKDYNGAVTFNRPEATAVQLLQKGVSPVFRRVHRCCEIFEAVDALLKQKNRIQVLVLAAHGNPHSMLFDDPLIAYHAWDPRSFRLQRTIKKLDPGTKVILESCSTGDERKGDSFARILSSYNPKITVVAAAKPVRFTHLDFSVAQTEDKRIAIHSEVIFKDWKNKDITRVFQAGKCIRSLA